MRVPDRFRRVVIRTARDVQRRRRPEPPPPPVPDCPPGWERRPPDVVIAGAEDAGAEWWDGRLRATGVVEPRWPMPLRTFDRAFERPWTEADSARYAAYFPRPAGHLAADCAVRVLGHFWAPAVLAQAAPEARVIVVLRDPIERLSAELARLTRPERPITHRDVAAAFGRGLYAQGVQRLFEAIPPERVLVLQLEACLADPGAELAGTLAFLGVASEAASGEADRGEALPFPAPAGPALGDDLRRSLVDGYAPDLERLATLCPTLDLDRWPTDRERRGLPTQTAPMA